MPVSDGSRPALNGYVTVRAFGGMAIPVPVQNMLLRSYCETNGFVYALPLNEHKYEGCFMQLFATLELLKGGGQVGMCSTAMLPQAPDLLNAIAERATAQSVALHFLFENTVARSAEDFEELMEFLRLRRMTERSGNQFAQVRNLFTDGSNIVPGDT